DRSRHCHTCHAVVRYFPTAHEIQKDWRFIGPVVIDARLPSTAADSPPPPTMNPPAPRGNPPRVPLVPIPLANPPPPGRDLDESPGPDRGVLARFLGWSKRAR